MKKTSLSLVCAMAIVASLAGRAHSAPGPADRETVGAAHAATYRTVIELFTSQGCSSCPPADKLLGQYAARADVIALSLPIDYWDYLGWKDTLASPKYSERQRSYARTRGDGLIYTPQVVVNGMTHVIGSNRGAIDKAIEKTRALLGAARVPVSMRMDANMLVVEMGDAPAGLSVKGDATVWLAVVERSVPVVIRRGENRGRKITYHNVVRALSPIGIWHGTAIIIRVPKRDMVIGNTDSCTVMVQNGRGGPIIGAAEIEIW